MKNFVKLAHSFQKWNRSHHFQPDDRDYQCSDEEQPGESGGFVEEENAYQYGADRSDSCPYRVGGADGYGLYGFCK